jgi:20S proteasome alpha/beta subunit
MSTVSFLRFLFLLPPPWCHGTFLPSGKGAVYSYDAVGSYDRVQVSAQGAGQPYIIPLLDNLIDRKNRCDPPTELTLEAAIDVVKEGFITAGEVGSQCVFG